MGEQLAIRLTRCPRCNYDISSLPRRHRCPECSFIYDEKMFVLEGWRLPGLGAWARSMVVVGPIAVIVLGVLRFEFGWGLGLIVAIMTVAGLGVGGLYLYARRHDRSGRRVLRRYLITEDGVALPGKHTRTYLWRNYSHLMLLADGESGWRLHLYPSWWRVFGPPIVNARLTCDGDEAETVRAEIQSRISAALRAEAETRPPKWG